MNNTIPTRYPVIDTIRSIAVILMIIFHLFFDLNNHNLISIDFQEETFWFIFPRVIVALFLFCVGISLSLDHEIQINKRKLLKRTLKLGFLALLISIASYYYEPKRWIFLGIIHAILILSIIGACMAKFRNISLVLGIVSLTIHFILLATIGDYSIINFPFSSYGQSMDYIPIYPWIGVVLIGIWAKKILCKPFCSTIALGPLNILGRHSLLIYLLHQPTLIGIILLYLKITRS